MGGIGENHNLKSQNETSLDNKQTKLDIFDILTQLQIDLERWPDLYRRPEAIPAIE